MDPVVKKNVLRAQRNELTEALIYEALAASVKDGAHRKILARIAQDERGHSALLKSISGEEVAPDRVRVLWYVAISRVLGLNFGLRLMERGEDLAQDVYDVLKKDHPGIEQLFLDEQKHEKELIDMIDEERLEYIGSIVLGLNDALVELTGALAGLTLALQDMRLIAIAGSITGIAAFS